MIQTIKLDQTVIPCVPFIWYREQEIVCPINSIEKVAGCEYEYVIVQRNIANDWNLYICLHSLMFHKMHMENTNQTGIITIPPHYAKSSQFCVKILPVGGSPIVEIPNGLKNNEWVNGQVYIHDMSFSPPGCLHFNVDPSKNRAEFIAVIRNSEMDINMSCLFIIFNDVAGDNFIKHVVT